MHLSVAVSHAAAHNPWKVLLQSSPQSDFFTSTFAQRSAQADEEKSFGTANFRGGMKCVVAKTMNNNNGMCMLVLVAVRIRQGNVLKNYGFPPVLI